MKIFTGKVVSAKRAKTVTVAVENVVVHPLYKKRFRRVTKYSVHDDKNAKVGDRVRFAASRPYSKTVKWSIVEVLSGVGVKKVEKGGRGAKSASSESK